MNAAAQAELEETKQEAEESVICPHVEDEDDDVIIQEIEPKPVIIEIIKDDDEEEEEAAAAAALKAENEAKLNELSKKIGIDSEISVDKKLGDDIALDSDIVMADSSADSKVVDLKMAVSAEINNGMLILFCCFYF